VQLPLHANEIVISAEVLYSVLDSLGSWFGYVWTESEPGFGGSSKQIFDYWSFVFSKKANEEVLNATHHPASSS
jgi:hypothetical protein